MNVKATISSGYRWRLGIIALACLAFAAWFFYDGAVVYPEQKRMYDEYMRFQQDYPTDYTTRWVDYATEQGWPADEQPEGRSDMDILMQYVFGGLVLPIGLLFLFGYVRAGGRWYAADDEGLRTSSGQFARWDQIKRIDKSRWKSKGIATVYYDDNGSERKITLDDWKFDRDATTQIVAAVDEKLGNTRSAQTEAEMAPAERKAEELAS